MSTDSTCMWCNAPAVDAHHLTGRAPGRFYLDPELVVPLCHDDHELAHDDLRAARVDVPARRSWSRLRAVEFRLERLALFLVEVVLDVRPFAVRAGDQRTQSSCPRRGGHSIGAPSSNSAATARAAHDLGLRYALQSFQGQGLRGTLGS